MTDKVKTVEEQIATAVQTAIKEAMPAVAAVIAASQPQGVASHPAYVPLVQQRAKVNYGVECQVCHQPANACGGVPKTKDKQGNEIEDVEKNHVKAVVYPAEDFDGFPGIWLNHVHYRSNSINHYIWIPRANESDFKVKLNHWTNAEREMRLGRKKEHKSGTMSPRGSNVQEAYIGPSGL